MPRSQLFDITVKLVHQTDKAWLVDDGDRKEWFPKSSYECDPNPDGTHTLTGPEYLLKEKGFL